MNTTQSILGGFAIAGSVTLNPLSAILFAAGTGGILILTSYTQPVQTQSISTYYFETFPVQVTLIGTNTTNQDIITWDTSTTENNAYLTTFTETEDAITTYNYSE